MKLKNNITALLAALGLLASCSDDVTSPTYTVDEAINAITLRAGISEGGEGVHTRAAEDHHTTPGHVNFTNGTQLRLRVDGTWTGHDPVSVSKTTTATTGDKTGADELHNVVNFTDAEKLYWDDYGTADPNNTTGRTTGLTIYGVAVNGLPTAPTISSWTNLSWSVGGPSGDPAIISQTGGWANEDLLTSNNIRIAPGDGTYKFDDYIYDLKNDPDRSSNLLEFTHAMTKITVQLTADEGFPRTDANDAATAHFESAPTVILEGFNYTGNVNVVAKTSTPTAATTNINMHLAEGGASHVATYDALVFPGNTFENTTQILTLSADGNTYKVTAAELNKAIQKAIAETATTGYPTGNGNTLLQAWNYKLLITVKKTDLDIKATILDWKTVVAAEETPKINVTATYGYTAGAVTGSTAFTNNYDLFRSTVKATGYDEDSGTAGINPAARFTSPAWDKTIYWPNHQTHYFFRGVYPQVGTAVSGTSAIDAEAVTTKSGNDVIAVANATYTEATYPSDLAIAIPRNTNGTLDESCKESGHTSQEGICATEGVINMNFEYAMSKVEVRLKSTATGQGHIDLTKDNTKVEIIGGYSKARIKLSDGLHDAYADADKGNYELSNLDTPVTDFLVTTLDAIVPQEIGNDVIFRITVITNDKGNADPSDDETDVYECKVNLINVKNSSPATPVTEWIHGKHYIYELDLNKTEINVTATLKDWVTVTASDNVWF